ncbi:MAG TPA: ATP-dependent DNA helicase RecG [Sporichthyaceae bacterium]
MTSEHHPLGESLHRVVGEATAKKLEKAFGMRTADDLLRHYPRRYEKRGELTPLAALERGSQVTVLAEVISVKSRSMQRRHGKIWELVVTDGRHQLNLVFFGNQHNARRLEKGHRALFSGTVGFYNGKPQLAHPEFHLVGDAEDELPIGDLPSGDRAATHWIGEMIPVYPATRAVQSWDIIKYVKEALAWASTKEFADPLPAELRAEHNLANLADALFIVHRPKDWAQAQWAKSRLRWEEAFVLQAALAQRRSATRGLPATPRVARPDGLLAAFDNRLPFELTTGQREVGEELTAELARSCPMNRLLQGEVGSGKTVVALRAMLAVVDAGGQAALLAPTEVLAQQHHRLLCALLGPLAEAGTLGGDENGTRVALLTGSLGTAARRAALLDAASGQAGIVVGTHALLQHKVEFADLGLVVVDEQHRFGVEQRDALRAKSITLPHLLVMTATPIPRTVAMTVFGDLDVSTLTELPAGRSPIATHVVPVADKPNFLDRAWQRIREEVTGGHQAYVVCPRIGEAEDEDGMPPDPFLEDEEERRPAAAVLDVAPDLAAGPLAGLRVDVLHGRMPTERKDAVMAAFAAGELDVLIATTVIEVGVDVPNATVMAVLDAERFGISQLHQLRGRVGRGTAAGLCLLITDAEAGTPARERLDAVAATTDGFELSRVDLLTRREGDVLGTSQSGGRSSLRILSVIRDADLIAAARVEATRVIDADPELRSLPALAAALADLLDTQRAGYLDKS